MKQAPVSTLILFALLVVGSTADDVLSQSRKLQQLCHPERGGGIATPGIGGFYTHPEVDGAKVDFCLTPGSGCGKQAADAFCQSKGLAFSDSYVAWTFAGSACGKTKFIGTKKSCTGSDCTGFRVISCAGNLVPDILDTILGTPQAPATVGPVPQEATQEILPEPVSPAEDSTTDAPAPSDAISKEPIDQTLDIGESQTPGQSNDSDQTSPSNPDLKNQASKSSTEQDNGSTLVSPVSADGSGEGSEQETAPKKDAEAAANTQTPKKDESPTDSSEDKADDKSTAKTHDVGTKDTNPEPAQQSSAKSQALGPNKPPGDSATKESDDGVVIEHPDIGDVVLPGQDDTDKKDSPATSPSGGSPTDQTKTPSSSGNDQDALFCQERGSQSASAAARAGCGSVITQCGTDASITQSQENLGGVAGRRLSQSLVDSSACKKLFADECQAAAFDNANGLCATLMGSGPNPGEERSSCKTAEEAREIFKSVVKDSCAIFMAGAFP